MKYNYMVSIFLLIFVIIISQGIYHYTNNKIIEGNRKKCGPGCKKNERKAKAAAMVQAKSAARAMRNLVSKFVNPRQTPYVNLLGRAYVNNQNPDNLTSYNEAVQIDTLAKQILPCNSDADIAKIFNLTSNILYGSGQNSTKVYFISEIISKSFGHFYNYEMTNNETQFNYLSVQFPKTFIDDASIQKKYFKFISLLALSHISKSTTSTSLSPTSIYFKDISKPIITECQNIISKLNTIKYDLTDEEKAAIESKYKTIVK